MTHLNIIIIPAANILILAGIFTGHLQGSAGSAGPIAYNPNSHATPTIQHRDRDEPAAVCGQRCDVGAEF